MKLGLIAAYSTTTRAIGAGGKLIWELPGDKNHFREVTRGEPVIMGRLTWESLPHEFRPLPKRINIVVTSDESFAPPGVFVARSFPEAFKIAEDEGHPDATAWAIGGERIYEAALARADVLDLTEVHDDTDGDVHFPVFSGFTEVSREPREENGISYDFVRYVRDATLST